MEINVFGQVLGAVAQEDLHVGRFVVLVPNVHSRTFGSLEDLPGIKLPKTADEAALARGVVAWPPDNRKMPAINYPTHPFGLREGGFERPPQNALQAQVFLSSPSVASTPPIIPSGTAAMVVFEGIVTIPSGAYIDSAAIRQPGTPVEVEFTSPHFGKPKAAASMSQATVGVVHSYNAQDASLTIKLLV